MECRALLFLLATALATWPAGAAQVAGVELPDEVQVAGLAKPLILNGAGVRRKFFVAVYVGALYLPQRQVGVGSLLSSPPPNRVAMHFVYSQVVKRQIDSAWREGFENNLSAQAFASLEPRLNRFVALFPAMREGDVVWLDYYPGGATMVSINGVKIGQIEGADFNSALLSVWLGQKPVTESLKKAMVGDDKD